jgi:hypothetical protein
LAFEALADEGGMSRHRTIGLTEYAVKLIDNWISVAHSGGSVVPRDFHRDVDLHEVRPNPIPAWAKPVEQIYVDVLAEDRNMAMAMAAQCFGAPKGFLRKLGYTIVQAESHLLLFGFYVNRIDLSKAEGESKLMAQAIQSYKISGEFGDLQTPLPRERIRKDGSVWQGKEGVHESFK